MEHFSSSRFALAKAKELEIKPRCGKWGVEAPQGLSAPAQGGQEWKPLFFLKSFFSCLICPFLATSETTLIFQSLSPITHLLWSPLQPLIPCLLQDRLSPCPTNPIAKDLTVNLAYVDFLVLELAAFQMSTVYECMSACIYRCTHSHTSLKHASAYALSLTPISSQNGNAQKHFFLDKRNLCAVGELRVIHPYGKEFAKHNLSVYCIKQFKLWLHFIFLFTEGWLFLHRHSSNRILSALFSPVPGSGSLQSAFCSWNRFYFNGFWSTCYSVINKC